MPGRRINRAQVGKYMEHRKQVEEAAAAKVGISVRSAHRIEWAGGGLRGRNDYSVEIACTEPDAPLQRCAPKRKMHDALANDR